MLWYSVELGMTTQPTSYEDTDVVNDTEYHYIVYVVDTDGDMSSQETVSATPTSKRSCSAWHAQH